MKKILKHILIIVRNWIKFHPALKSFILYILSPFPRLKGRIKRIGQIMENSGGGREIFFNRIDKQIGIDGLSAEAKIIYEKLKTAFERQNNEK